MVPVEVVPPSGISLGCQLVVVDALDTFLSWVFLKVGTRLCTVNETCGLDAYIHVNETDGHSV